jgi:methionyl-tRNA synthetase
MKNTFYITTPIYYPSNKFTLGNCYTTVICDALARFNKKLGKQVFFLTGTDEHGEKIQKIAEKANKTPMQYLDEMIADSKALWKLLGIEYDKFIRTTDDYHVDAVKKAFKDLYDKGYIYKSYYEGLYCVPCESFWTESQLVEGKCPDCGRDVQAQKEEAYFFKLSQFGDKLLKLYEQNPNFLQPATRVNEMINNFIKPGLQDLCVSRTSIKWGIEVDFDPKHTVYVWIDALLNYVTALGYNSQDTTLLEKFWPADVHVMGKEIVRFHAIIWPAILMALDLPLPKTVYGHGWVLFGGDKLSKSKETGKKEVIDPRILLPIYGPDAIRYILLREIPFGQDGTYTTEKFLNRINSDLANDYGNLVSRTFAMTKKYFDSVVPSPSENTELDEEFCNFVENAKQNTFKAIENLDVSVALAEIFSIFAKANKYVDTAAPWTLAKDPEKQDQLKTVMYNLLEAINIGSKLLWPFLPFSTQKVLKAMGEQNKNFDSISHFGTLPPDTVLGQVEVLFPRLDIAKELEKLSEIANQ